jgi:Fe2+ transport system protein B
MKFCKKDKEQILELFRQRNISLEGNFLKVIESEEDKDFEEYVKQCIEKDKEARKKRLEITKRIQSQNTELSNLNESNQNIMRELTDSLARVEDSKNQIENQNKELLLWREENEKISQELKDAILKSEVARLEAERAKDHAQNDLSLLQKKTQFELISIIVKVALFVILGVGLITTALYMLAIYTDKDTQIIGSTWSNMFGILLTNAFSIIGTIMGVKYASENGNKTSDI